VRTTGQHLARRDAREQIGHRRRGPGSGQGLERRAGVGVGDPDRIEGEVPHRDAIVDVVGQGQPAHAVESGAATDGVGGEAEALLASIEDLARRRGGDEQPAAHSQERADSNPAPQAHACSFPSVLSRTV